MENKEITMKTNKKLNAFENATDSKKTIAIALNVDKDKLIGKTFEEVATDIAKTVIKAVLCPVPSGELHLTEEFYNVCMESVVEDVWVNSGDIELLMNKPFIPTTKPTDFSIKRCGNCYVEYDGDSEDDSNKPTEIPSTGIPKAKGEAMTYKRIKELGIFSELMPNGFNLYLDAEEIEDSEKAKFDYDPYEDVYKLNGTSMVMTREDVDESEISIIGSDPMGDFVPAVWIIPNDEFLRRYFQSDKELTDDEYEAIINSQ